MVKGSSKRKRTKEEIEEVKGEEEELKEDRHSFLKRIKKLKEDKAELESMVDQISMQQLPQSVNSSAVASKSSHGPFNI